METIGQDHGSLICRRFSGAHESAQVLGRSLPGCAAGVSLVGWSGRVAGVVEAARHTGGRCSWFVGAGGVQCLAAGELPAFGGQGCASVDLVLRPVRDVQE